MDPLARQAFADWTLAQPAVSAFVHVLVADRAERDDVLQDVAVAVLEAYGSYDRARPFLPWALGIARHAAADSLRRRRRQPMLMAPEAADALAGALSEVAESERARLAHLPDCLQELDGRAREACELRYRAGLERTLAGSKARHRFIFIHHLVGGMGGSESRGGVESAPFFEWGGKNADGSDGFAEHRPGWPMPIHPLLVKHGVSAVFHGHDHLYVHGQLDGIHYQCVPQPGNIAGGTRSAAHYGYASGTIMGSPGYVRVRVDADEAKVEFVRTAIAGGRSGRARRGEGDAAADEPNGAIVDSYVIRRASSVSPGAMRGESPQDSKPRQGGGGRQRKGPPQDGVVKPAMSDTVHGAAYADNWFAMYVNGKLVAVDSIDFLPHNVVSLDILPEYPMTIAVLAKDNADPKTGCEYGAQIGDGGFILKFADGTVTDARWKAKCFMHGPVDRKVDSPSVRTEPLPDGWERPGFDDSSWPQAVEYSQERIDPKQPFFEHDFKGAKWIWTGDLDLDNTVVLRTTVEKPGWKPRWSTKPDLQVASPAPTWAK
jgi:RNA polymerase sigma factor (sigma-70 family)